MRIDVSKWEWDVKVLQKCSLKGLSSEERPNNQVDRMTHPVNTSWPFPQPLLSLVNGLMDNVVLWLRIMDFSSPGLMWCQLLVSPISQMQIQEMRNDCQDPLTVSQD